MEGEAVAVKEKDKQLRNVIKRVKEVKKGERGHGEGDKIETIFVFHYPG